jgi:hypothetical protein
MVLRKGQRVRVIRGSDLPFRPHLVGALGTARATQVYPKDAAGVDAEFGTFYLVLLGQPSDGLICFFPASTTAVSEHCGHPGSSTLERPRCFSSDPAVGGWCNGTEEPHHALLR